MAAHSYSLRSRIHSPSPSLRTTPASPITPKINTRRHVQADVSLQLQKVIGTTTINPSGLSCCSAINSYSYCAGAVAVLAKVDEAGMVSHRYFRARPTAPSINPSTSHYDNSPAHTPSKRRTSTFTPRKTEDGFGRSAVGREWPDDTGSQTWTARERIKAASCVTLSRDGRWLAVGETGYHPRVLLFSAAEDASLEIPTSIVCDHTNGVRCVAFSPDMKHLATLGNHNDGFLFVWAFNSRSGQLTLHSVNKCTTSICDMTWCGSTLVTVGTRHIKLWQITDSTKQSPTRQPRFRRSDVYPASPGPTPLQGRNCLLGNMVDSTFTCITSVDDNHFVVGTETGHICVVDILQSTLELRILRRMEVAVTSITYLKSTKELLVGTTLGVQHEDYEALTKAKSESLKAVVSGGAKRVSSRPSAVRRSLGFPSREARHVTAIGKIDSHTVTLDSEGSLHLHPSSADSESHAQSLSSAHNSAIQGVLGLPMASGLGDFITWSKNGEVKFWDISGKLLRQQDLNLEQPGGNDDNYENELNRMQFMSCLTGFIAGDRYGILKLINSAEWRVVHSIRAHSAEISGIALHDSDSLVATCSRDRMVQLFQVSQDCFELLQTMDDHVGAVNEVKFSPSGDRLLSCASDRSLVIRDRVLRCQDGVQIPAYLSTKVLTLKASPLSITPSTDNSMLIATMDRRITKVDCTAGALMDSFKLGDSENDDTVFLNSITSTHGPKGLDQGERVVIGYCSMDKSIRVYNERNLALLGRDSGHTEGISDIACLGEVGTVSPGPTTIVSTGLDGTIMIWNLAKKPASAVDTSPERSSALGAVPDDAESPTARQNPTSLPPLRKVLTKIDFGEMARSNLPPSPSSPRSLSPVRLKRKTSRLALSTTIEDIEENSSQSQGKPETADKVSPVTSTDLRRSPSPPPRVSLRPKPQRARTDSSRDSGTGSISVFERSPSPPQLSFPSQIPPKHKQKPTNIRLRRPPSIPSDLRLQTSVQGRRQSMSGVSDFGSIGMATEQACRMLRTYRKRLNNSKDIIDLEDLEDEVIAMLKTIQERKGRTQSKLSTARRIKGAEINAEILEKDIDQLTILMERANMAGTEGTRLLQGTAKEMMASNV